MSKDLSAKEKMRCGEIEVDKFNILTVDDFPKLPVQEWLIEPVISVNTLAAVYGPSGVGKSFLCLHIAAAVALGAPLFGCATKVSTVIYIALEGQAGLRRRVEAWEKHHQRKFPRSVKFVFDEFVLNELEDPFFLAMQINQTGRAGLIIIDTINRAAPNADENRSTDMGAIIAGAELLMKETGATVILVHHPGKDATKSLRGHSSLFAALDTVIEVSQDGNVIKWRTAKSKDGESNIAHGFTLVPVDIGLSSTGKPYRSCVVQEIEGYTAQQETAEALGANQRIILAAATGVLVEQKLQVLLGDDAWQEGIAFDDLLPRVTESLRHVDVKHRKSRAKDALNSLVRQRYFEVKNGRVCCAPE